MNDVLRVERSKLNSDLQSKRQELDRLQAEVKRLEEQVMLMDRLLQMRGTEAEVPTSSRHFLDVAEDVLRPRGALGMPVRELYAELARQDVVIPGQNPQANLIAHMSNRRDRFSNPRRGYWAVADGK